MTFSLPNLPYDYAVLEPYIDKETMFIHHTGHHKAYVTKLNDALKDRPTNDLVSIQFEAADYPTVVRNNAGGHYNHCFFWKCMAPVGSSNSAPTGNLKVAISEAFGSVEEMKNKFTEAALTRFGSGWAWLGVKPDGTLGITSTANQDNPLMKKVAEIEMYPILGLDVWEHAYYLKYQNKRNEYIQQWWNVVNWDEIVERFAHVTGKNAPVAF